MGTKSILLAVTDPQMLVDITQALGAEWEATSAASEADALEQLQKRSFDALLVDFNLGSPDASELLNQALEKNPETVRYLLAQEADLALVAAKVLGSPQILPNPCEPATLKSRIEDGINNSRPHQNISESPAETCAAPAIPPIYSEVLKVYDSPGFTSKQVAKVIASDTALKTEVLRLTRSAYKGLPRNVTDTVEAVESLGLETVKALVLALRFLAEHSHLKPGYLSVEQIWQHSTNVGQIARDLVLFETKDRVLASQALAAGLLHDLGKVVLVTNFDDLYGRVHSLARKQPVPIWEIEKEMFGANHGEIGACLVGMWNMPMSIVDAAALHHDPPLGENDRLTPLAAVHIANVLERELRPSEEYRVAPVINTAFLNELGLLQRLPIWRATSANRNPASQRSNEEPIETRSGNHVTGPATATRTATLEESNDDAMEMAPAPRTWQRRWVYAGIAAGILFLLALWLRTQLDFDESAPIYARTPATAQAPVAASPSPVAEIAPAATPQVTPATVVSEEPQATNDSYVPMPELFQSAPEPTPSIASEPAVINVRPASVPPKEKSLPDFRLNGIIYTIARPSAIVNGQTVYVGDEVTGATVVSIGQTEVALRINGQRLRLALGK